MSATVNVLAAWAKDTACPLDEANRRAETYAAVAELAAAAREQADARCALIYAGLSYDEEAHRTGSRMQEANRRLDVALAKFGGAE